VTDPAAIRRPEPTGPAAMDRALAELGERRAAWSRVGSDERAALIDEAARRLAARADDWVAVSLAAKGFPAGSMAEAEEWLYVAAIMRAFRMLRRTLREIDRSGRPRIPGPIRRLADGRIAARVVPRDGWDRLLYRDVTVEVRLAPDASEEDLFPARADTVTAHGAGAVRAPIALVLGGGNASMLPVIDALHKLFVEHCLVVLKPNPVNAYLGPFLEDVFQPLIERGFVRMVYGGEAEGEHLCHHALVDELHLTGSGRTFEAIVFGTGEDGRRRKAAGEPLLRKRFTCELGNVGPVIVVPGPWSRADIDDQAVQIATWLVANAGFACLAPRVLIQHRTWPLRLALVDALSRVLDEVPTRNAYYPGALETHAAFLAAHPGARLLGGGVANGHLPWTLIDDVVPTRRDEICFTREAFCGLMAETALDAADAVEFLEHAVDFANASLHGSLAAVLLVHPASLRDNRTAAAVERAIDRLRYGAVLVNMGAFAALYFMVAPWGAHPGHHAADIQSGVGKTASLLLIPDSEKTVVRGPFRKRPDPLRLTSPGAPAFARALASFEAAPSPRRAVAVLRATLAGWRPRATQRD
jgi:acyl-CoA reductase-like NAD-dependent aldehyde dehydrogenase